MVCCDDLKRIAYFFLDGELGEDQGKAVQSHLDGCPFCQDRILIHRRIRLFIRSRLVAQPASEQLRQRIHAAVNGKHAAS
jgi:mycothiol system anti-sigma-R factor